MQYKNSLLPCILLDSHKLQKPYGRTIYKIGTTPFVIEKQNLLSIVRMNGDIIDNENNETLPINGGLII